MSIVATPVAVSDVEAVRRRPVLLPAVSLARRELVRFLRQKHRIVGALATPIVFWLLIGAGMGRSFKNTGEGAGGNYLHYFYPGTVETPCSQGAKQPGKQSRRLISHRWTQMHTDKSLLIGIHLCSSCSSVADSLFFFSAPPRLGVSASRRSI